jgi:hypothetical protein
MHDQAVPGESVRKKDTGDENLFSDIEMLSTPAPIMAPPPGTRGRAPARPYKRTQAPIGNRVIASGSGGAA